MCRQCFNYEMINCSDCGKYVCSESECSFHCGDCDCDDTKCIECANVLDCTLCSGSSCGNCGHSCSSCDEHICTLCWSNPDGESPLDFTSGQVCRSCGAGLIVTQSQPVRFHIND